MGKRLRKIISILLVIVMIIGMCPNSVVLAKESMDSGMTATSTDAEEGITEDNNTEESDPFIESEKSDTSTETDIQIDEETYPAFNPEPVIIDGVRISVSAAEGVFPEGASLSVAKVSNAELGAVEEALDVERDETEKVAISYTYDIKVFDKDGNELQPEEGADVKVSFSMDAVANENLETNVYHISEDASGSLSADILPTEEDGTTVSASTDGFSYYTVEFTYDEKQYIMQGDTSVALVDILSFVGITKADGNAAEDSDISAVSVSDEELFSASNESGEWIVTAHQAFTSTEWMKITVDEVEYEIVVTDATYNIGATLASGPNGCSVSSGTPAIGTTVSSGSTFSITVTNSNLGTGESYTYNYQVNVDGTQFSYGVLSQGIYIGKGKSATVGSFNISKDLVYQSASASLSGNLYLVIFNFDSPVSKDASYSSTNSFTYDGNEKTAVTGSNVDITGTYKATNAGDYTAYVTPKDGHAWNDGTTDQKTVNWSINKATNPLTYTSTQSVTKTYSTSSQTATLTAASNGQGNVSYSITSGNGSNYFSLNGTTLTIAANTPAGTYSPVITAAAAGNSNYNSGSKTSTVTVTISKANISPSVTMAGWTYGGTASTPSVSGNTGNGTVTYAYKVSTANDSTYTSTKPSNAGTYTVKATIATTTNYNSGSATADFTISKANNPITFTATQSVSKTFSTSSQTATLAAASNGQGNITYAIKSQPSGNYFSLSGTTLTIAASTPAGTYAVVVSATAAGNSNYNSGTKDSTVTVTIGKTSSSATPPTVANKTYNGSAQTIANAGSATGGTIYYGLGASTTSEPSASSWSTLLPSATDAGSYYIWYKVTGDSNHNDIAATYVATATISNATIIVNAPDQSYTYNGSAQGTAITVTTVGSQTATIKYGLTSGTYNLNTAPTATNVADSKTIYYQVTAPNHTTKTGSYTLTITKATLTVTAREYSITYGDAPVAYDSTSEGITAGIIVTGFMNGETLATSGVDTTGLTYTFTYSQGGNVYAEENEDYGIFKIRPSGLVSDNYNFDYVQGDLKVYKKEITVGASVYSKYYDGTTTAEYNRTSCSIDGLVPGDTLSIDYTNATASFDNKNAGTDKTVTFSGISFSGDKADNYKLSAQPESTTASIWKKPITISGITASNKEYDGNTTATLNYSNVTYDGIVDGDSLTISATGVFEDKNVGTEKTVNISELVLGGTDIANYELSSSGHQTTATAAITAKNLTITGLGASNKVYDGMTTATVTGTAVLNGIIAGDTVTVSAGTAAFTDKNAGTGKTVTFTDYSIAGEDAANYTVTQPADVTANITSKPVTVSGITASNKEYDGTVDAELICTGTSFDGIVSGDTLTVTATGTFAAAEGNPGFKVGEGKTVSITGLTLGGLSVSNYVLAADGQQTSTTADITQKAITITADSDSKVYDGTPLTKSTYTNTALATDDTIESVTVIGSQTVVGSSNNVPSAAIIKNGTIDVSDCYNITYTNGTLTVTKKAVTITAESDIKVYDGTALTKNSFTATGLAEGDSIATTDITITGSQTVVGTSNNVPSNAVIKNAADVDVTASYDITYANGTLEVTKKAVTITAGSDTKVYDGTALTKDSVTSDGLITGDTIDSVTVVGSQIYIGTSDNVPSNAVIKNADEEDVTSSYDITYANGTLEVTKKTVTITADSDSKVYDGTALTKNSFTADGLATGDSIAEEDITITGSQTVVGSSDNVASGAVIKNSADEDVTDNYEITYANGTLTVTQALVTVTITGHNNTADYDGEEHSVSGYDVTISNTLYTEADFIFSGTASVARTDAGTSSMGLAADQFTNNNDNFNITFNVTDGYQTITPINAVVTIVGNSNSTVYDGSEHSVTGYTATACLEGSTTATDLYDVANDFTFSGTAAAARTDAGTTNMGLAADQFVNTNPNFATVTFNVTDGYQTIEQIGEVTVSITGHNDAANYDGESHSVSGYDVEISNPLYTESDFTFSGNASAARTDAGTTNMGLVESQFTNTNENFNTVNFVITDGYQTIDPINVTVTITGNNDTVDYDGESHVVTGYTATADSDLYDVDEDFTFNGSASASRTNAGTTSMGLAVAQFENTNTNFATVTFDVTDGYITVNKINATVTITGNHNISVYDGEEHTVSGYTASADTDLYNVDTSFTFSGTANSAQTDVGTTYMELAKDQFENTNTNFETVTFEVTDGYQTITTKSLTITADSDTKVYNGTALSKDTYTNTELAEGDSIESVVITGSQTNIGESDNVPSNAVIKNGDKDVIANYNITYVNGKLKVTPKTVTVKADNKSKKYGDTDPVCTATVTGTVGTDTVDYSFSRATGEDVGDYTITPSGDATQGNYAVTYETGKLTITKATLAIEAEAKEKTYGEDDPELTYTISGLQNSDTEDIMTGELSRAEGKNTGTYAISQGTVAAGNNYNIDYTGANLTINRKEVTVKANDKTKTYGSPDPAYNATVTGMVSGENASDLLTYSFSREVGDAVGTYTITPSGNAVQGNYTVSYETGTLTIGKKTVIVTAKDKTIIYGDAPDNDGVEYSGFAYDEDESVLEGTLSYTYIYSQYGDVGEYTITPSGLTSENYAISFVNGTLTVEQKEVGIEWGETSFTYDGKSHMPTATATGLVNGDAITVSVSGARTAADTGYTATATSLTGAKAGNYKLPEDKTTTFSIGKKALTITADSDEKEYDGTALTKNSYTSTALIEGESIDSITITGSQTAAGTSSNTPSEAIIKNAAGGDVTSNYAITYVNGILTVTAKAVTVMADDKTKVYGDADPDLSATVTGLVGNDKVNYTLSRSVGEDVGEYTITPSGDAVQGNYSITYETGTLTVGKKSITATITGHNNITVYDTAEHSVSGYDVSFSDDLYKEAYITFNGTASAVRAEAGTTNMGLKISQFTNNNENFDVTFIVTDGYQKITKAANSTVVTLDDWTYEKAANEPNVVADFGADTAVYTYYTDEGCTSKTGTAVSDGRAFAEGGKPTQAGTYYVKAEIAGTDDYAAASDSTSFKINKADITITADDKSSKYKEDIETLTWQVGGDYAEGDELGITAVTTATDTSATGVYPITLSWNENPNYNAEIKDGTYTITKTDLKVTASAYAGTYDGGEHSITVDVEGNTEAVVYYSDTTELTIDNYNAAGKLAVPTRKNAGTTTVYYFVLAGNYNPDPVRGSKDITIAPKAATVTADDKSKVYGEDDVDLTAVVSGTVGEEKPDYTLSRAAGEKAGEYTITVTAGDNPNYEVSTVNGIFTIERADITVTADNKSIVYGNTDPELTATVTGLKRNDDETVIDYTLSRTVGEKAGTYDITAVGDSVQDNYNVQYESGLFTITEKIETAPDIKVAVGDYTYDGLEKLPEVSVYDGDTLIPADEYTVSYSDNTGAGTATITIIDKEGGNYTVNGETTFIINKADQDAPEEKAISVKNATDGTSNDGIIDGVNDSMEYSTDGGKSWKSVEEGKTSIDGLGAGEVLIRLKADKNHNSGAAITVTIPAQGDVEVYLRKIGDAPTITVRNSKAELAGKLLSDTEKKSIKDGEDVDIYLTEEDITDSISDADRKLIESALNDGEAIGLYLDVNLYKKVGNAEPVQITDTNGYSIRLGINLPDILVNKDSKVSRSFRVLRLHDSSVKEVPSQYNGDEKRIDTESDRFSIFAIVYKDVTEEKTTTEDTEKEKTTTEESGKNSTEKPNKEETTTEKKTTPSKVEPYAKQNDGTNNANTGDGTPIAVIILIMMLSLGICVAIIRKKKNQVE